MSSGPTEWSWQFKVLMGESGHELNMRGFRVVTEKCRVKFSAVKNTHTTLTFSKHTNKSTKSPEHAETWHLNWASPGSKIRKQKVKNALKNALTQQLTIALIKVVLIWMEDWVHHFSSSPAYILLKLCLASAFGEQIPTLFHFHIEHVAFNSMTAGCPISFCSWEDNFSLHRAG